MKIPFFRKIFFKYTVVVLTLLTLQACSSVSTGLSEGKSHKERAFQVQTKPFYKISEPLQCVPYAREVSGIQIFGNAHTWWDQAEDKGYRRGQKPKSGAVFVLDNSNRLRHGHTAVVKKIIDKRVIEVAHSNWGNTRENRRYIYTRMPVKDVSPNNDWTQVKFWNYQTNAYGSPYVASGFIYP